MGDELKPCPFCGGKATIGKSQEESPKYKIYCKRCAAVIKSSYLEGLIKVWNRRVENERD